MKFLESILAKPGEGDGKSSEIPSTTPEPATSAPTGTESGLVAPKRGEGGNESTIPVALDSGSALAASAASNASGELAKRKGRHPVGCQCGNCIWSNPERRAQNDARKRQRDLAAGKPVSMPDFASASTTPSAPGYTDQDRSAAKATIEALTHTADTLVVLAFSKQFRDAGASEQTLAAIKSRLIMQPEMRKGITASGVMVAEKYGVAPNVPELALGGYLLTYILCLRMLWIEVFAEAKRARQEARNDESQEKVRRLSEAQ